MTPPHPHRPRARRATRILTAATLSLALVGSLAACGSDDTADASGSPAADVTSSSPRRPAPTGKGYQGNAEATVADEVCDAAVELAAAMGEMPQEPAEVGPFVEEEMLPLAEAVADGLDGDATTAGAKVATAYAAAAESGTPEALEDPAVAEAQREVGRALHEGCDLEAVDVQAQEYAFIGAPSKLPAGRYSFALDNKGVEDHEMVLLRRAEGVTESFEEIAELPEEEMMAKVAFTGVTFGGPGTVNYLPIDLEPGTYFLSCFIPVGGGEDGPPHFMEGMQQTLEVS